MSSESNKGILMLCKCGKEARILRPHEGRAYCGNCLVKLMRRRFKRELRSLGIEKGDEVVIFVPRCSMFYPLLLGELEKVFAKWKELKLIALVFWKDCEDFAELKTSKVETRRLEISSKPTNCQECIASQLEVVRKFARRRQTKMISSLVLEEVVALFLRTLLEGTPIFLWSPLWFLRRKEAKICAELQGLTIRDDCGLKDRVAKTIDEMLEDLERKHAGILNQLYTSAKVIGRNPLID